MKGTASQQFVPIKSIRDGVILLDNGEYRAILMTNSLNIALKGEDEQMAILTQFQNFFNSLDFPIQIFVQSRRADIGPYIEMLQDRLKIVQEELLKLQIIEYIDYVRTFSEETNIMEKSFFVVVPYVPAIVGGGANGGLLSSLSVGGVGDKAARELKNFEEIKRQVGDRVAVVSMGLSRCGLRVEQLRTEEAIELFYELYNPGTESKAIIN